MIRTIYKVARSVAMSIVIAAAALYALVYMALNIPAVQDAIRNRTATELSRFIGSEVKIGSLQIIPFNALVVNDLTVYDLNNEKVADIERLSAGISLWKLISGDGIVITHAELLGGDFNVYQQQEGQSLNIQFIIDAFSPKDKNKPPTRLRLQLRHIILRQCAVRYDKRWMPKTAPDKFDVNHIRITSLGADASVPVIITGHGSREDRVEVNLKRLTFVAAPGLKVNKFQCKATIVPSELSLTDILLQMPGTSLGFSPIVLNCSTPYNYKEAFDNSDGITVSLSHESSNRVFTLSDFAPLWRPLASFTDKNTIQSFNVRIGDHKGVVTLHTASSSSVPGIAGTVSLEKSKTGNAIAIDFKGSLNIQGTCANRWVNALSVSHPNLKVLDAIDYIGTGEQETELSAIISDRKLQTATLSLPHLSAIGRMGELNLSAKITKNGNAITVAATAETGGFHFDALGLPSVSSNLKSLSGLASVDGTLVGNSVQDLSVDVALDYLRLSTMQLTGLSANADIRKDVEGYTIEGDVESDDPLAAIKASAAATVTQDKKLTALQLDADVRNFNLSLIKKSGTVKGSVNISATDLLSPQVSGKATLENIVWKQPDGKTLAANYVGLTTVESGGFRSTTVLTPWIEGSVEGHYTFSELPNLFKVNDIIFASEKSDVADNNISEEEPATGNTSHLHFTIPVKANELIKFFGFPVNLITPASVTGGFTAGSRLMRIAIDAPYLSQGKKLISNTRLEVMSSPVTGLSFAATTTIPAKASDVTLSLKADAFHGTGKTDIRWKFNREESFEGLLSLDADYTARSANLNIRQTQFTVNDTVWVIEPASIAYADKRVAIRGVNVWSGTQSLAINGDASSAASDTIRLELTEMDLDYIFSTLGINYVTFGGRATGDFYAADLFTKAPVLYTPRLNVEGLTYNGGYLGDADIRSRWISDQKEVAILADIHDNGSHVATIDGGIWTGRDSLAFALDANKVNIKFLQPFMKAFTSEVNGRASGRAVLYGTFKDIDLKGRLFADTITLKVDFTNTTYGGSDSVIIDPGMIHINDFILHDRYDNTAILNGFVGHNYFHEPRFRFAVTNARQLLCYDTNPLLNPIWYGRIFGTGSATIEGEPGVVNILVDMQTALQSQFTFVLTDQLEAGDYNFLTFTDQRKAAVMASKPTPADTVPEAVRQFHRNTQQEQQSGRDEFNLDLRATVTPDAELILIMDPVAGDRIRAFGSGTLQLGYTYPSEDLTMYGKYTLDRGMYNFSLQDVILKTFTIRPGSFISFNGDPYAANLDITAAYRVQTNLKDLDKSFSQDRDLNRTNVPVEAVLHVNGDMRHPEVTFDIDLPTLNADALRKVKSIISTDDMMSRQIVYLLALNRFYTPEYMGNSGSGGERELAAIASSTLSANLSNILGQLSPNWSISPNIRTDKGDFSDTEVDLALSSQLFNNRLLLNGNFGYRDRSTSSTTFIGDFDLEYLLNRRGSLRLKAYNHFNDQNYYLKSALTTQGIGIIYKHDFNTWFKFLRPKKGKPEEPSESK